MRQHDKSCKAVVSKHIRFQKIDFAYRPQISLSDSTFSFSLGLQATAFSRRLQHSLSCCSCHLKGYNSRNETIAFVKRQHISLWYLDLLLNVWMLNTWKLLGDAIVCRILRTILPGWYSHNLAHNHAKQVCWYFCKAGLQGQIAHAQSCQCNVHTNLVDKSRSLRCIRMILTALITNDDDTNDTNDTNDDDDLNTNDSDRFSRIILSAQIVLSTDEFTIPPTCTKNLLFINSTQYTQILSHYCDIDSSEVHEHKKWYKLFTAFITTQGTKDPQLCQQTFNRTHTISTIIRGRTKSDAQRVTHKEWTHKETHTISPIIRGRTKSWENSNNLIQSWLSW